MEMGRVVPCGSRHWDLVKLGTWGSFQPPKQFGFLCLWCQKHSAKGHWFGGVKRPASPGGVVGGGRDVFVSRWNKRENISQRLRRKEHHLHLRNLCSLLLGDIMFNQLGSKKNGCDWKMILKPFWGRSFFGRSSLNFRELYMLVSWRVLVWRSKARAGEFNHLPTFRASAPQEWQILSWLLTFLHPFYCYIGNMVVFPATNIPCDWKITFFWEVKGYLLAFFLHLWSWNSTYNRNTVDCKKKKIFSRQNISKSGELWWDYDLKCVTW